MKKNGILKAGRDNHASHAKAWNPPSADSGTFCALFCKERWERWVTWVGDCCRGFVNLVGFVDLKECGVFVLFCLAFG